MKREKWREWFSIISFAFRARFSDGLKNPTDLIVGFFYFEACKTLDDVLSFIKLCASFCLLRRLQYRHLPKS
jgi:hypothetical protein